MTDTKILMPRTTDQTTALVCFIEELQKTQAQIPPPDLLVALCLNLARSFLLDTTDLNPPPAHMEAGINGVLNLLYDATTRYVEKSAPGVTVVHVNETSPSERS